MRRIREVLALGFVLACAGCVRFAPARWLPEPRELARWPYGASVDVRIHQHRDPPIHGELIAIGRDSVYVLTREGLRGVPCREVRSVRTQVDRRARLRVPELSFFRGQQKEGQPISPKWQGLAPYARFPRGLPDSLDRGVLRLPPER